MEPTLGTQIGDLSAFIVWPYLLIFVMLSYLVKKTFGDILQKIARFKWKPVFTVLIIATIVGIPYGIFSEVTWIQILVTYTLGTSFHELILEYIVKGITKLFGGE